MFVLATLISLIEQVSGTPYVWGGDSPAGTDCSGLASWVSNLATDRPIFGDRFSTADEEAALLARGFQYGTAPGALVIGWNNDHTALTLPDGTPVSSGEGGGVQIGGGGAYEPEFTNHMFLPIGPLAFTLAPPPAVLIAAATPEPPAPEPAPVEPVVAGLPAPQPAPVVPVAEPPAPAPAPAGDVAGPNV